MIAGIIGFFFLVQLHEKLKLKKNYYQALVEINQQEITFLETGEASFEGGEIHHEAQHFYAQDLDFFGTSSLFQFLNRTALVIGEQKLALHLKNLATKNEILLRQEAIKELNTKLDWRQSYWAMAKVGQEKEKTYKSLLLWSKQELKHPATFYRVLGFALPTFLFISIAVTYLLPGQFWGSLIQPLIITDLFVAFSQVKYIRNELQYSDEIKNSLKSYAYLFTQIENETFESEKLTNLQKQLKQNGKSASKATGELAKIYANLDNVSNPFGAILFNALTLYHVHSLHKLKLWKARYAPSIEQWIQVLGEFEALNSLSNFSYNNPEFAFPSLDESKGIEFTKLGHPLIDERKRVCNNVSFKDNRFIILTGSNMSGKSTFLRSLGINMVLGQIGAPVCANQANIIPMPVLVSMRVSDNLSEGESFFFAEVKRLKQIMNSARKERSFVLLDEILRGTNSDDKRTGTIEVIKNIIQEETIGAIATHDLKVCDTTNQYPTILTNKCFEVEIEHNELVFDYQLREGICKNKSATFLMKKMGVI